MNIELDKNDDRMVESNSGVDNNWEERDPKVDGACSVTICITVEWYPRI